jgi:TRAP-type C4-dicarboxylate transport system substrate-binding protein
MTLPYLYRDYRDVFKVTASAWFAAMQKIAAQKGLKMFPQNWVFGTRHFISDKTIKTPADVKGMKVRVPPNKVQLEMITAMGGNPVTIAWGEVYTSLSQGVVDALECTLPEMDSSKLYEARKKVALTGHIKGMNGLIMSQKVFDALPAEHKQLLEEATLKHSARFSESIARDESTLWRQKLEGRGMAFNDSDVAAFAKATEVVASKFSWTPGTVDKIKAALK